MVMILQPMRLVTILVYTTPFRATAMRRMMRLQIHQETIQTIYMDVMLIKIVALMIPGMILYQII